MNLGWIPAAVLPLTCWWGGGRLITAGRPPAYLLAVTLALLGLASAVGAAKIGFEWRTRLDELHFYAFHAFGVAGLYLLSMAMLDWIGWLRLHQGLWLAHLADAALVFGLALWLRQLPSFHWVIVWLANLVCLLVAVSLWRRERVGHAKWLAFAAILFLANFFLIGDATGSMLESPVRMGFFQLLLTLWVYCMTQVVRHPPESVV